MRCFSIRNLVPIVTVAALAAFSSGCGPSLAFEPAGPEAAPDPAVTGPYAVGVQTVWLTDLTREDPYGEAPGRRFKVEVWYPAAEESRDAPRYQMDLLSEAPESVKVALDGITVPIIEEPAARDAPVHEEDLPFPVIVFSHGNGGIRDQSFTYTAHLASHGYVVVSPDHVGNTLFDMLDVTDVGSSMMNSLFDRPEDLRFILDAIASGTFDERGEISAASDLGRVGVTGHSLGGLTSLFASHPNGEAFDDRYQAAVPITPATSVLRLLAAPVKEMEIPVLYVGATADETLGYQEETVDAYEQGEQDKAMVGVVGAGHFSFTEVCEIDLVSVSLALGMSADIAGLMDDGCGPQNIPVPRAQALNNWYGTAWFNVYLRDSERTATTYLDPAKAPEDVEWRISRPGLSAP